MTTEICTHCGQDHTLGYGPECPSNPVYGPVIWNSVSSPLYASRAFEAGSVARVGQFTLYASCNYLHGWTATIVNARMTVVRRQQKLRDENAAKISAEALLAEMTALGEIA